MALNRKVIHRHPLKSVELLDGGECAGCWRIISAVDYVFGCEECKFFVHKSCGEARQLIKHPTFGVMSISEESRLKRNCDCCLKSKSRALYYYKSTFGSARGAGLDFECALLVPSKKYEGHEHPLTLVENLDNENTECNSCNTRPCNYLVFRCIPCNYNIHSHCIPSFQPPSVITRNEYHPALLTLTEHTDKASFLEVFHCDICRDERNPQHPFYHCANCRFATHVHCVISFAMASSLAKGQQIEPILDQNVAESRCQLPSSLAKGQQIKPILEPRHQKPQAARYKPTQKGMKRHGKPRKTILNGGARQLDKAPSPQRQNRPFSPAISSTLASPTAHHHDKAYEPDYESSLSRSEIGSSKKQEARGQDLTDGEYEEDRERDEDFEAKTMLPERAKTEDVVEDQTKDIIKFASTSTLLPDESQQISNQKKLDQDYGDLNSPQFPQIEEYNVEARTNFLEKAKIDAPNVKKQAQEFDKDLTDHVTKSEALGTCKDITKSESSSTLPSYGSQLITRQAPADFNSPQFSQIEEYNVDKENIPMAIAILNKYGDPFAGCSLRRVSRILYFKILIQFCNFVTNPSIVEEYDLDFIIGAIEDVEQAGGKLAWLRESVSFFHGEDVVQAGGKLAWLRESVSFYHSMKEIARIQAQERNIKEQIDKLQVQLDQYAAARAAIVQTLPQGFDPNNPLGLR